MSENQNAEKTELQQHKEDVMAFINTLPPRTVAKAIIMLTVQGARKSIEDPEVFRQVVNILKARDFVNTLTEIVATEKLEGALEEMASLDLEDVLYESAYDDSGEGLAGKGVAFNLMKTKEDNIEAELAVEE